MSKPIYDRAAGGFGAIKATWQHLRRETGVVRGTRLLLQVNQQEGFDCPGCAWPEPSDRSRFEFCENGAKAVAEEATTKRATPAVFAQRSIDELRALGDFELGQLGRITHPMVLRPGSRHYEAISWDDALSLCAAEIRGLASPDQAVFYTSGRTSNEAAFLFQLMVRQLGTNNLPDCSNMCHESSGVGLSEVIGAGKGTVGLDDFDRADAIFVIGQNPGTNHPRMLTTLREAARRGCVIVSINPLKEPGLTRFSHPQKVGDLLGGGQVLASEHLPVKIGGDVAVLAGIIKAVLELDDVSPVLDREFIAAHTSGLGALSRAIGELSWREIVDNGGVDEEAIRRVAGIYARAERVIACWAMGITQHVNAVANVHQIVNLMLLRGNLGRPGAGLCPVRGHSNVQGDRTMGITSFPKPGFLDRLETELGFEPPRRPGLDTVAAIEAMLRGEIGVFFALGGNFCAAAPDSEAVQRGLGRCALTVQVSTKVNRSHLYPGRTGLILPCLGRTELDMQAAGEQFVTVEDSMSIVHRSQGALAPASAELRSEPAIVAGLARRVCTGSSVDWAHLVDDYDRIRDLIARVVPGCEEYNARVRTATGFRLPNGARDRVFATETGKAMFTVHALPELALPAGRLRMMTIRSHDQYNTTVYGLDDRYRGVHGERRVVFLHPDDMAELGIGERQEVDLVSEHAGTERIARGFLAIGFDIPRGCAATYFPEANVLVPRDSKADKSNTPASKSVVIRIEARDPVKTRS